MRIATALLMAAIALTGCGEPAQHGAVPPPAQLTRGAIGHYCSMIVVDHAGPKGQIFIVGREQPLWFSSVRDTVAFTLLEEELAEIRAVYVNDMARAGSWDSPGPDTWIPAREALFVIGSSRRGGMGAQEAVPFSSHQKAAAFAGAHGGRIVAFDAIPPEYILGDAWPAGEPGANGHAHDVPR